MSEKLSICYLCDSPRVTFAFKKNGIDVYTCVTCGLYFIGSHDSYDAFLSQYYTEAYFVGQGDIFGYADYMKEEKSIRRNSTSLLKRIATYVTAGKLLDVGCAAGFFMDEALKKDYDVYGIETSEYIASHACDSVKKRIQLTALHNALLPDLQFDVVTMLDLIEHLSDPRNDLIRINRSMKPNGLLVIATGDTESFYTKILKSHSHYFAPPHHLFCFSRTTITELLNQSGFQVEHIESMGKWLTFPYIARVSKHFNFPLLSSLLQNNFVFTLFKNLWIYLYFGDNMVVYARKV